MCFSRQIYKKKRKEKKKIQNRKNKENYDGERWKKEDKKIFEKNFCNFIKEEIYGGRRWSFGRRRRRRRQRRQRRQTNPRASQMFQQTALNVLDGLDMQSPMQQGGNFLQNAVMDYGKQEMMGAVTDAVMPSITSGLAGLGESVAASAGGLAGLGETFAGLGTAISGILPEILPLILL